MWPDQSQMRLSSVGVSLLVISVAVGGAAMALTGSRTALAIGALVGLYFLFSIRIAYQWEKVAVLRFGRFTGLRGPGLFYIVPIVDRLSRYVDQRVRVARRNGRIHADARHRAGERGRHRLLAGVERGEVHSRSAGIYAGDHTERADRAARIHRPSRAASDGGRARNAGPRIAAHTRRKDHTVGHHRAIRGDSRCADPAGVAGRHVAARRRRNASGGRAPFWGWRKPKSPRCSARPR